jgi:hypothetical protein
MERVILSRSTIHGLPAGTPDGELTRSCVRCCATTMTTPARANRCVTTTTQRGAELVNALAVTEGRELDPVLAAAALAAAVISQDFDEDAEGLFRVTRRVAWDWMISAVDVQLRHGQKASRPRGRRLLGTRQHQPGREIVTATTITPATPRTRRQPKPCSPIKPARILPSQRRAPGKALWRRGLRCGGPSPLWKIRISTLGYDPGTVPPPGGLFGNDRYVELGADRASSGSRRRHGRLLVATTNLAGVRARAALHTG